VASNKPDSFQCGPFEVARNPDVRSFVEKLNCLREAVDACRIQPGLGYTVNRSTNGTVLSIRQDGGSAAATYEHPFKLSVRKKDKQYQFYALNGTVGNRNVKPDNIEKWVAFKAPARIYLEAKISDLAITDITIKTQDNDSTLERTVVNGGKQTYARISLGSYIPATEGQKDYHIIQNVTTNILSPLFCYSGYPALALTQEFINAYYA
jgi:hypothetical protein